MRWVPKATGLTNGPNRRWQRSSSDEAEAESKDLDASM